MGEPISGRRAYEVGLVGQLTPRGGALGRARELAERLAANGPLAVRNIKASVLETLRRRRWTEAPDGRMRAFQLGRTTQWEKSRLSHQLTRMEKRGLVRREATTTRYPEIALTAQGQAAIAACAPVNAARVREFFVDVLGRPVSRRSGRFPRTSPPRSPGTYLKAVNCIEMWCRHPIGRGGPGWWSSRYATFDWWVAAHLRANSVGVRSPWAVWGRLAL